MTGTQQAGYQEQKGLVLITGFAIAYILLIN